MYSLLIESLNMQALESGRKFDLFPLILESYTYVKNHYAQSNKKYQCGRGVS